MKVTLASFSNFDKATGAADKEFRAVRKERNKKVKAKKNKFLATLEKKQNKEWESYFASNKGKSFAQNYKDFMALDKKQSIEVINGLQAIEQEFGSRAGAQN